MTDPTLTDAEGLALWLETNPGQTTEDWYEMLPQTRRAYGNVARDPEAQERRSKLKAKAEQIA